MPQVKKIHLKNHDEQPEVLYNIIINITVHKRIQTLKWPRRF